MEWDFWDGANNAAVASGASERCSAGRVRDGTVGASELPQRRAALTGVARQVGLFSDVLG